MYDFQRKDLIIRAISKTIEARDKLGKNVLCLVCGEERISFPSQIEITADAEENYSATIVETKEVPSEDAWVPLAGFGAAGNVNTGKTFLVCPKCAREKGLVEEPDPIPAIAEELKKLEVAPLPTIPAPKSATGTEEDIPF